MERKSPLALENGMHGERSQESSRMEGLFESRLLFVGTGLCTNFNPASVLSFVK